MRRAFFIWSLLFLAVPGALAGGSLRRVAFLPQWLPQAQFAGYYVAREKGIYAAHGLDVEIIAGGPTRSCLDYLKSGKADFGTLWLSSAMKFAAHGEPIVNVAQMMQRSALMLVARKASGIREPKDLKGKKVGLFPEDFLIQPRAFFDLYGIDARGVTTFSPVDLFLRGGVDAVSVMWYNEYHALLNAGLEPDELTRFFFHEHDLNFPEDGIYALKKTCGQSPETVRAFAEASIEGWNHAFAHPEEALDIIMRIMREKKIPASRIHQKWMLERMRDLMVLSGPGPVTGVLDKRDYERIAQVLKSEKLVTSVPDFESFAFEPASHAAQ